MPRTLPRWMHLNHGRYYLVRKNKWTPLSRNLHDALVEYARLTTGPDAGALGELVARALADMKKTVAASTFKNYMTCSPLRRHQRDGPLRRAGEDARPCADRHDARPGRRHRARQGAAPLGKRWCNHAYILFTIRTVWLLPTKEAL